jgi:hypothetical protein
MLLMSCQVQLLVHPLVEGGSGGRRLGISSNRFAHPHAGSGKNASNDVPEKGIQ